MKGKEIFFVLDFWFQQKEIKSDLETERKILGEGRRRKAAHERKGKKRRQEESLPVKATPESARWQRGGFEEARWQCGLKRGTRKRKVKKGAVVGGRELCVFLAQRERK